MTRTDEILNARNGMVVMDIPYGGKYWQELYLADSSFSQIFEDWRILIYRIGGAHDLSVGGTGYRYRYIDARARAFA